MNSPSVGLPPPPPPDPGAPAGMSRYLVATAISVVAILSQYVVPSTFPGIAPLYHTLVSGVLIIYGIPIAAFALLVGREPLRAWATEPLRAALEGLRWYGVSSVVALVVLFLMLLVYAIVDPGALDLLRRMNPVLTSAQSNPWFWVAFSFVIGGLEETIFRGWIFGFWERAAPARWKEAAVGSSVLFAAVHLYYATTYGVAAPLLFPTIFFLGLGFAIAFHYSGGNLVAIALLHGANDGLAFYGLVAPNLANALRFALIAAGGLLAVALALRSSGGRAADRLL